MAREERGTDSIATAPVTPSERFAAAWIVIAFLAALGITLPHAAQSLGELPSFLPTVIAAASICGILTAILFYVQYRIVREPPLALLALAYATAAVLNIFFVLCFPGVFAPAGLLGATPQSAAWIKTAEQLLLGATLIAFALADRFGWRIDRGRVRLLGVALAAVAAAVVLLALNGPLPPVVQAGLPTPLVTHVLVPLEILALLVVLLLLATSGLGTVTRLWMFVAALGFMVVIVAGSYPSGVRFTLGWYAARLFELAASGVMLAVFLVKINDLLLRTSSRNRALTERTAIAALEIAEGELRYRSLANVVPQLIWSHDADSRVEYVNDRWIAYTGMDLETTREYGWREALKADEPIWMDDPWHESLRTGQPFGAECRLREGATGRMRWFLVNVVPIRDAGGAIVRWIGSCTDIDQSKRIEEREAFLTGAGDRLSASLDLSDTVEAIVNLVIGRMAAWARLDLLDEEGRLTPAAVASEEIQEEIALRPLLGHPAEGKIAALLGVALAKRDLHVDDDAPYLADGAAARAGTTILIPLTSGEAWLGVLSLVRGGRGRPDADDLGIARDFGRRASQALDHALLYERERTTADALQRAMLPQVLPQLEHISFSASYSAASESQRVGGDFYDAFTLPDGRVALTIGDVTGHGLEAAVIMGEIRHAIRATAFERAEPAVILDRASRLLVASGRTLFVTAVFAVLDTQTGWFRYATAGHPPPLVYDGTELIPLAGSGLPLGLRDDDGVEFALTLPPACTIVLYTDGLIEFGRNLDEGERRLEAAIRELADGRVEHLAAALMKRVLAEDQASDDIAILTATAGAFPQHASRNEREWRFHSGDAQTGAFVRRVIGPLVAAWTGRPEAAQSSELAFGELFSNVVRYAPGTIDVRLVSGPDDVQLIVADRGPGFAGLPARIEELAEAGRGLALVRAVADAVEIEPGAGGGSRIQVTFSAATSSSAKRA